MAKRKRLGTRFFKTIDEIAEYVKQVKGINGDIVQCEITEMFDGWCIVVWQIR